jgi:hypothetical protein
MPAPFSLSSASVTSRAAGCPSFYFFRSLILFFFSIICNNQGSFIPHRCTRRSPTHTYHPCTLTPTPMVPAHTYHPCMLTPAPMVPAHTYHPCTLTPAPMVSMHTLHLSTQLPPSRHPHIWLNLTNWVPRNIFPWYHVQRPCLIPGIPDRCYSTGPFHFASLRSGMVCFCSVSSAHTTGRLRTRCPGANLSTLTRMTDKFMIWSAAVSSKNIPMSFPELRN